MCVFLHAQPGRVAQVQKLIKGLIERQDRGGGSLAEAWARQFSDAIVPGATTDADGIAAPLTITAAVLHYICITWKLLFAFGPPPQLGGGLPCFFACLVYMAGITYLITNFATMFGCAVGLSDQMTALTVLAVGTSTPSAFGSYQAAVEAPDADAAMANITGSNALNVFVGLGVPWVIATIYYGATGEKYVTPSGPLRLSALVYFVRLFARCLASSRRSDLQRGSLRLEAVCV
jgi:solute carrier family 8 (sodium/calcium exchanger)